MYRRYPNKQNHGTRGQKKQHQTAGYRWFASCEKAQIAYEKKLFDHIINIEIKKFDVDCTDEEIEEFEKKTQFAPKSAKWYWWD